MESVAVKGSIDKNPANGPVAQRLEQGTHNPQFCGEKRVISGLNTLAEPPELGRFSHIFRPFCG